MIERQTLNIALEQVLQTERFKDYCPNGLQVEGTVVVNKVVSGVTASAAFIRAAIAEGADTLLVHHGLFWRGQNGCITGWMRQRLGLLLEHNLNLFAYHLPLDAHPEYGNNIQLARKLGFTVEGSFGEQQLGLWGTPTSLRFNDTDALASHITRILGRNIVTVHGHSRNIQRVAWCTGGAQSYFEAAIATGVDAFITGEISEPQAHYARECGVSYLACGHHATERYGVQALGNYLSSQFAVEHTFLDIDNPA